MLPLSKRGISVLYIVLLHPSNVSLGMHTESSNRLCLPDLWKVVMCTLQGAQLCTKKPLASVHLRKETMPDFFGIFLSLIKRRHKSNCIMGDSASHSFEGADVTCRVGNTSVGIKGLVYGKAGQFCQGQLGIRIVVNS